MESARRTQMGRSECKLEALRTRWLMGVKRQGVHCPKGLWKDVLVAHSAVSLWDRKTPRKLSLVKGMLKA